jgi:teichuronic acid exporter
MNNDISIKLKDSFLYVSIERFGVIVIQFLANIILARLLTPEDYGIVAMVSLFIGISAIIVDSGLAGSLIFRNDVEEIDYHTIFWFNIIISIIIYLIILFSAPFISNFYNTPIISKIICSIGLTIIINAFSIVQSTKLQKELKFKSLAIIGILSSIIASIISIIIAIKDGGVWALVYLQLLQTTLNSIMLILTNKYIPKFSFSFSTLKKHLYFGSSLLSSSLLKIIYENFYSQAIGKIISIANSGYYNQARRLNDVPVNITASILDKAVFPVISKIKSKKEFILQASKLIRIILLLTVPLCIIMNIYSKDIISLTLGEKWQNSSWILSWLSLGSLGVILETIIRNLIKSTGRSKLIFHIELVKRISGICIILALSYWQLKGILMAFIINSFIASILNSWGLSKSVNYKIIDQIKNIFSLLFLWFIPFIAIMSIKYFYQSLHLINILIGSFVFFTIYIILIFATKIPERIYLINSYKKIINILLKQTISTTKHQNYSNTNFK